jgi:hypothetical protein
MIKWVTVLFVLLIGAAVSNSSYAAEISCSPGSSRPDFCKAGLLNGTIDKGDYEKMARFLRAHHPNLNEFYLISSGGDVIEALRIAHLFRKYLITTFSPIHYADGTTSTVFACRGNCGYCASACALIWFGGVERWGTVGLHRPSVVDPAFRSSAYRDAAATVYREMLAVIAGYLKDMEVPNSIIDTMFETASSDLRWVESVGDPLERPPSIAEWEDASCPGDTIQNMYRKFGEPSKQQRLDGNNKGNCDARLMNEHRSRLAPPPVLFVDLLDDAAPAQARNE